MKKLLLIIVLGSALLSVSCAKEKVATQTTEPQVIIDPIIDPVVDPTTPTGTGILGGYGAASALTVSADRLEDFLTQPTNSPENIQIYVDLQENSDETFSGKASIYVTDRGVARSYSFYTGSQRFSFYNKFIHNDGAFHAVFDDGNTGMIVLVIDDIVDLGDGQGAEAIVGGKVYYKNYKVVYGRDGTPQAPHPLRNGGEAYCWTITAGPYQCRPWSGLSDANNSALPTGSDLRLLGTFNNLNINKALNL